MGAGHPEPAAARPERAATGAAPGIRDGRSAARLFRRSVVALIAGGFFAGPAIAEAELIGVFHWQRQEPFFGGISAIDVQPDGFGFIATGDNAQNLIGELVREEGRIIGVESPWIGGWRMPDGARVDEDFADSEGIALGPDGRIYVSFEREHRVWGYADRDGVPEPMADQSAFEGLRYNRALEALAIDSEGQLFAIPEKPPRGSDEVPIYRQNGSGWDIVATLPEESFRPTGADFDDMGRLYLLERGFGLFGFSTRVRRIELGPDGVTSIETLLETGGGVHDNLEGIAVWRDDRGFQRIIMISDDNFRWFQRTEIVEYRLTE